MEVKDLRRIIREESEDVVIDFEQKKREREHKARVQQIILDSIESHGISLIVGIPDEQAEQIRNGAEPLISVSSNVTDELEIATEELKQRKIPFIIERKIGNKKEYWKIEDLKY